jgi:hypothetical protein
VRLKLPFVYGRSDESWGHTDIGGVGDIEVATGTALRLDNSCRTAGGVELHADTASKSTLGDSVWRLSRFGRSPTTLRIGSRWPSLANTAIPLLKNTQFRRMVIWSCLYGPSLSFRPIGRSVRSTKRKSILRIATVGLRQ